MPHASHADIVRDSHAFAIAHFRYTVAAEIDIASAVSSIDNGKETQLDDFSLLRIGFDNSASAMSKRNIKALRLGEAIFSSR